MALSWVAANARDGSIIADLPDFAPQGTCKTTIGAYNTLSGTLPLPTEVIAWANDPSGNPPLGQLADWRASTFPGGTVLAALDETDTPVWGGLVLTRTTDQSAAANLSLATLEAYLDRRYCGDKIYSVEGQNDMVTDLINSFILDGTLPGLPIAVATSGANTARDHNYFDTDDKTLYAVMQDLMGVIGGTEWTVGWQRLHGPERICPVLYVADRLGSAPAEGLSPNAHFDLPGNVISAQLVEDYSSGMGANLVTATTGSVAGRLASSATSADFAGRPTFEYRWQPSTSITGTETLADHAARALAVLGGGSKAVTITAAIQDAPRFGVDWNIGDDIGYSLMAPAWIDGLLADGAGRCIGWERDDDTIFRSSPCQTFRRCDITQPGFPQSQMPVDESWVGRQIKDLSRRIDQLLGSLHLKIDGATGNVVFDTSTGNLIIGDPAGNRIELYVDEGGSVGRISFFLDADDSDGASLGHGIDPLGIPYDVLLERGNAAIGLLDASVTLNVYDVDAGLATGQVEVFSSGVIMSAFNGAGGIQISTDTNVTVGGNLVFVEGLDNGTPGFFEDASGNLKYRTHSGNVRTVATA